MAIDIHSGTDLHAAQELQRLAREAQLPPTAPVVGTPAFAEWARHDSPGGHLRNALAMCNLLGDEVDDDTRRAIERRLHAALQLLDARAARAVLVYVRPWNDAVARARHDVRIARALDSDPGETSSQQALYIAGLARIELYQLGYTIGWDGLVAVALALLKSTPGLSPYELARYVIDDALAWPEV